MVKEVYGTFGMKFTAKLSTMPDDHAGEKEQWDIATAALRRALEANGMAYEIKEKEGAFYGPKIDFDVVDAQGRVWQCATAQLDYQMPRSFGLEYTGEDGRQHMPIMIHRAMLGSMERFIGVMVEHYQGKFPTWLSPVQVKVISISEQASGYAEEVYKELRKARLRAKVDISDKTMAYKLREAIEDKVPYIVVLGGREAESKKITVRARSGAQKQGVELKEFIANIKDEISERKAGQLF
ncbi:Threonine--tRNA ligase [uncultured archaeon]|nr:Threonine--tRNA ligase [uncultured archaeon]